MADPKMLVLGSFTEDETKSLLAKQSSKNHEKPIEKEVLQFGSINFVSENSSTVANGQPAKNPGSSEGETQLLPSDLVKKGSELKQERTLDCFQTAELVTPAENGCGVDAAHGSIASNGVKEVLVYNVDSALPSVSLIEDEFSSSLKLQYKKALNGSVVESNEEIKKTLNVPVVDSSKLLHRGLKNSGDLCFLNATLQALLSCSPFVQLLLELRTRNIPKVGHPIWTAFVE